MIEMILEKHKKFTKQLKKARKYRKNLEYLISTADAEGNLHDIDGHPNGLTVKFLEGQIARLQINQYDDILL